MSVLTVSNCFLIVAYIFLWIGITSSTWRHERGYEYTLWQRCDRHGCIHEVTGLKNYLAIVRVGALFSLLCLSICVSGIVLNRFTFHCRRQWQKRAVDVLAASAALALAPCLGLYGYKTVMKGKQQNYPALDSGFAFCAFAVMFNLGASILRAMGPVRTWEDGLSFLLPKDGLLLENRLNYIKCKKRQFRQQQRMHTMPLLSMFYDRGNSYYAYASVVSSRSDILRRHSYEEIDAADMPAPPPELLEPPPPPPPCPAPRTRSAEFPEPIRPSSRSTLESGQSSPLDRPRRPKRSRKQHSQHYGSSSLQKDHRRPSHYSPSSSSSCAKEERYHTMPSRAAN